MSVSIPENYVDLLTSKKAFAHLATVMSDGSPQVTPIWIDYDGTYILFNSAKGRLKDRNIEQRSQVALEISDPDNPYRYLTVRGKVVEITEEGADDHIDKLAYKYTGQDKYQGHSPLQTRRIYKVAVEKVSTTG